MPSRVEGEVMEIVRSEEQLTDPATNTYTITYYWSDGSTTSRTVQADSTVRPVNLQALMKDVYGK